MNGDRTMGQFPPKCIEIYRGHLLCQFPVVFLQKKVRSRCVGSTQVSFLWTLVWPLAVSGCLCWSQGVAHDKRIDGFGAVAQFWVPLASREINELNAAWIYQEGICSLERLRISNEECFECGCVKIFAGCKARGINESTKMESNERDQRCLSAQTPCLWLWSELCCRYSCALSGALLVLTFSCWLDLLACPADLPLMIPVAITALLCWPCLAHLYCALVEDPSPGTVWIQALCPLWTCESFCWVPCSMAEGRMQNMSFVSSSMWPWGIWGCKLKFPVLYQLGFPRSFLQQR